MTKQSILRQAFLDYLQEQEINKPPTGLYQPVNYIMALGGKRMRPVLLLMSHDLFKDDHTPALSAAYAIEIFHNFTLVHDDIMDHAPLRRGKATVHEKFGADTAILSGDVMMILAYRYIQDLPAETLARVLPVFNRFAIEVCEGQQYDMEFESAEEVAIEAYLKMIELKTSVLLAGAMEIGALIGGSSSEDASHLAEFGRNVGIAFQLQDDILDTFGDPEKFGKKVGGDIAQNKKTFLFLKALELAGPEELKRLNSYYRQEEEVDEARKIKEVTHCFSNLGIREEAEKVKLDYLKKGLDHLEAVQVAASKKEELIAFATQLMARET